MPRVCDWKNLQVGDIFSIVNPTPELAYQIGIYIPTHQLLTLREDKYICYVPGKAAVTRHPSHPGYNRGFVDQPVEVYEMSELPHHKLFGSLVSKVTNTTGSDPEIFVVRGQERRTLLPAYKFLPKQADAQTAAGHYHSINSFHPRVKSFAYRDGFAAECFIQPVSCHGYLIDFLRDGMQNVLKAATTYDRTAKLTLRNTFTIPKVTMDAATDEDVALGCMPSANAYDDAPMPPTDAREFRLRFAGGHVHLGMALPPNHVAAVVKACDVTAAIPAVAIFASLDNPVRRQFYGRAGEYRNPKHGLEYRTLSNAWLATPEIAHLMLNLVRTGAKVGINGYNKYFGLEDKAVQEIINFCDVPAARKYVLDHLDMYLALLSSEGLTNAWNERSRYALKTLVEGGIEALFPDFEDLEKNWKLTGTWWDHSNRLEATWGAKCNTVNIPVASNTAG